MEIRRYLGKFFICMLVVVLCVGGGNAFAGLLKAGDDKKSIEVYGQITRAILYADDGNEGEVYNVDNDNSSTRIGLRAKYSPDGKLTIGANLEFEYQVDPSDKVWQDDKNYSGTDADKFEDRIIEAYAQGFFGTVSMGKGSTASDGTTEKDLSGTKIISASKVHNMAGGIRFFDKTTNTLSTTKVSTVFNNLDGYSMQDRIRYDTPLFHGFQLSGSLTTGDDDAAGDDATVTDAALTYKGSIGETTVQGAVAYVNYGSTSYYKDLICGSISVLLKSGLNATFAAGTRDKSDSTLDDSSYYYGKLGYKVTIFSVGPTAFAVDYGTYTDINRTSNNDDADTFGIFVVQNVTQWKTELYLGYRNYSLNRAGSDFEDVNAVMTGIRIKF